MQSKTYKRNIFNCGCGTCASYTIEPDAFLQQHWRTYQFKRILNTPINNFLERRTFICIPFSLPVYLLCIFNNWLLDWCIGIVSGGWALVINGFIILYITTESNWVWNLKRNGTVLSSVVNSVCRAYSTHSKLQWPLLSLTNARVYDLNNINICFWNTQQTSMLHTTPKKIITQINEDC